MYKTRKTIFSIDDDEQILATMRTLLGEAGYNVKTATSGEQGLRQLAQMRTKPHLILLDIDMPGMDGYAVCQELQKHKTLSAVPVVFLANGQHKPDPQRTVLAGGVEFISKPVNKAVLCDAVARHLANKDKWLEQIGQYLIGSRARREEPPPAPPIAPLAPPMAPPPARLKPRNITKSLVPVRRGTSRLPALTNDFARFKDFLLHHAGMTPAQRDRLRLAQVANLYQTAAECGLSPAVVAERLAFFFRYSFLEEIPPAAINLGILPVLFCRRNLIVPLQLNDGSMGFVFSNPFNIELMDTVKRHRAAKIFVATPELIQQLFTQATPPPPPPPAPPPETPSQAQEHMSDLMEQLQPRYQQAGVEIVEGVTREADPPLIQLVNRLIEEAFQAGASDIHIEPWEHEVVVRLRIDGEMTTVHRLQPQQLIHPIVGRLKIMGNMDISEKRMPQDGRIIYKHFARTQLDFDLRVSTAPMNYGEKVVMRLIDKNKSIPPLERLGFSEKNLALYRAKIASPYGMILHVGPTGSGKSLSLYSSLREIQRPGINIQTAEDPIEYTLPGINQLQVHRDIGLTFHHALRSFLRQDPDVILLGEIRDRETADMAVEASLTGHLLLSTLHTNDAAATITRFLEMGIQPYMLSSSITMICAQRLIRKLCPDCRQPLRPGNREKRLLEQAGIAWEQAALFQPVGCPVCKHIGYRGRIGAHEILVPNNAIRQAITRPGISADDIRLLAVAQTGMTTMFQDAMEKVAQGISAIDEVITRVRPDEEA